MISISPNPVCRGRALSCTMNSFAVPSRFRLRLLLLQDKWSPYPFAYLGRDLAYVVRTFSSSSTAFRSALLSTRAFGRFGRSTSKQRRRRKQADKSVGFSCRFPASVPARTALDSLRRSCSVGEQTCTHNRRSDAKRACHNGIRGAIVRYERPQLTLATETLNQLLDRGSRS